MEEPKKKSKMPKKLQKSLQEYISKIKKQTPHLHLSHRSISSTTCKILPAFKHPKTRLSFSGELKGGQSHEQPQTDEAATLEDIDKFLFENFKSLYGQNTGHDNDYGLTREKEIRKEKRSQDRHVLKDGKILFDSSRHFTLPLDLSDSQRFFVSPTSSGSLLEEVGMLNEGIYTSDDVGSSSTSRGNSRAHTPDYVKSETSGMIPGVQNCITVLTVSPNPYEDFRRSMQETVEARIQNNQRVDWDFMEELLFCYLKLNEKNQYRYILGAFVDQIVVLRQNPCYGGPEGSRSFDGDKIISKGKKRGDF